MQAVFIMIKCELGKAYELADLVVDEIAEVSEVYSTSGQFDLMAKFYLEDGVDIGKFVSTKVHTLPHIRDTYTIIAFNAFTR